MVNQLAAYTSVLMIAIMKEIANDEATAKCLMNNEMKRNARFN